MATPTAFYLGILMKFSPPLGGVRMFVLLLRELLKEIAYFELYPHPDIYLTLILYDVHI